MTKLYTKSKVEFEFIFYIVEETCIPILSRCVLRFLITITTSTIIAMMTMIATTIPIMDTVDRVESSDRIKTNCDNIL